MQCLWQIIAQGKPYPHYYGLADGAMNHYIYAHLQAYEVPCVALLNREDLPPEQRAWLFELRKDHLFSQWYLQESQGKYWGVIFGTPLALSELAAHLLHFFTVQDEAGCLHWIRAYDPRVTRAYLSALNDEQRAALFEPQLGWWAEDLAYDNPVIHYQMQEGKLDARFMYFEP